MGQVIAAIQQKGGAGKSTLLQCLAGGLVRENARILIVDTDPQKSSEAWAETTDAKNLDSFAFQDENRIHDVIEKVRHEYDAVLIDTAGFDSRMATYVVGLSDVIFIPTNGSRADVTGAAQTWTHVQALTRGSQVTPVTRVVFWKVKPNTNVYSHARDAIKKASIPSLPGVVKNLTGFDNMSWNGGLPDGAALQAVDDFLGRLRREKLIEFWTINSAEAA